MLSTLKLDLICAKAILSDKAYRVGWLNEEGNCALVSISLIECQIKCQIFCILRQK